MSQNQARFNDDGYAFTVQSMSPKKAILQESGILPYLKRSKAQGAELAEQFGGEWRYVPGSGCRGGWIVEFPTVAELVSFFQRTSGVPVTVWVSNPAQHPIPAEFAVIRHDTFEHNPETGYYDRKVSEPREEVISC